MNVYDPKRGWIDLVPENFEFSPKNIRSDDSLLIENQRIIEDSKHNIEQLLRGAINYYNRFEQIDPADRGAVDELQTLSNRLSKQLNDLRRF